MPHLFCNERRICFSRRLLSSCSWWTSRRTRIWHSEEAVSGPCRTTAMVCRTSLWASSCSRSTSRRNTPSRAQTRPALGRTFVTRWCACANCSNRAGHRALLLTSFRKLHYANLISDLISANNVGHFWLILWPHCSEEFGQFPSHIGELELEYGYVHE